MKTFINVAQMKLATLQAGQFVETGGYYVKGDAGQAKYLIVAAQAADGYGDHTLANGTVAVLQNGDAINVKQFGAKGDGTTDDTAPIKAAIAHIIVSKIYLPTGTYLITEQLDVTSNCTGFIGDGEADSILAKGFSGNLIQSSNQGATFSDFEIVGNQSSFAGGGFYMVADDCDIQRVRITDTTDACIIFEHNNSTYNTVTDCFLQASNNGYGIRSTGADLSTGPTARVFTRIKGGAALVNFAGMNRAILTDSFGTRIGFDASSDKIGVHNCRFTNALEDITILGNGHSFTGNMFGFGATYELSVASGVQTLSFDSSNSITGAGSTNITITDLNPVGDVSTTNNIHTNLEQYVPVWGGTTTDGDFGSGFTSYFSRAGRVCTMQFGYVKPASGSVFPVGFWSLNLPFRAKVTATGPLMLKTSAGAWISGTVVVQGGSNKAFLYLDGYGLVDSTSFAFSTNSQVYCNITYILD